MASATTISYLYEDLPDGHTLQAEEWDSAMSLIKSAVNNHALMLNRGVSRVSIPVARTAWESSGQGYYQYAIAGGMHNGGSKPSIQILDSDRNEYPNLVRSVSETGDIILRSPIQLTVEVIIL